MKTQITDEVLADEYARMAADQAREKEAAE